MKAVQTQNTEVPVDVVKPDWVGAMLGSDRIKFNARVCSTPNKMRLIATHLPSATTVELEVCGIGNADIEAARGQLCDRLALELVTLGVVDHGLGQLARLLRCEYANQLIQVISSYGLCYFYSRKHDRVAFLSYSGRVHLHDESGAVIEVRTQSKWPGFSHGGTLRDLVLQLRNYIMRGERIDPAYIGIDLHNGARNAWGYPVSQIRLCREAAKQLPVLGEPEQMERAA